MASQQQTDEDMKPSLSKIMAEEPLQSPTLPWDNFSNWLHCVCVVTFDLELGQAMEIVYPGHVKITEKEKMNICYLSFPDSNSGCMGDTQFHFRIRRCAGRKSHIEAHEDYNRDCPAALQSHPGYYYGYVYFRQTKDASIRRGYFQKSVVLISELPFIHLFTELVKIVAPEYFANGESCLEAACHDLDQWRAPAPGEVHNLPIMGSVLQVRVPCRTDKITGGAVNTHPLPAMSANYILATIYEVDVFTALQPILPHIQLLWELVLTGDPLVVMAALPTTCSQAVQALVGTIWPLRYSSDYRPYFTIHDSEFKEYTTKTQAPPGVIVGVTNPFFAKTLQHWPHIVRIGEVSGDSSKGGFKKLQKAGNIKTLDSKPGVYTRYKPFLNKDKAILKRILKGIKYNRPGEVQNAILKQYFLELTQSFMMPLERYLSSLMPLQKNVSPYKGPPKLRAFDFEDFLKTVQQNGPKLTSELKGDWVGLYRKFFRSANFVEWLLLRTNEVNQKLQAVHIEAICQADLSAWVQDKQEVEIVDLILRIRDKVASASAKKIPVPLEMVEKLESHMSSIISTLPDDLQLVLTSN